MYNDALCDIGTYLRSTIYTQVTTHKFLIIIWKEAITCYLRLQNLNSAHNYHQIIELQCWGWWQLAMPSQCTLGHLQSCHTSGCYLTQKLVCIRDTLNFQ